MARSYVVDLPGGTATTTITFNTTGSLKKALLSMVTAAAGSVELSKNPLSQIGTAVPTADVLARWRIGATAGHLVNEMDISAGFKFKPLDTIYVHQTGAGNVGEMNLTT